MELRIWVAYRNDVGPFEKGVNVRLLQLAAVVFEVKRLQWVDELICLVMCLLNCFNLLLYSLQFFRQGKLYFASSMLFARINLDRKVAQVVHNCSKHREKRKVQKELRASMLARHL